MRNISLLCRCRFCGFYHSVELWFAQSHGWEPISSNRHKVRRVWSAVVFKFELEGIFMLLEFIEAVDPSVIHMKAIVVST